MRKHISLFLLLHYLQIFKSGIIRLYKLPLSWLESCLILFLTLNANHILTISKLACIQASSLWSRTFIYCILSTILLICSFLSTFPTSTWGHAPFSPPFRPLLEVMLLSQYLSNPSFTRSTFILLFHKGKFSFPFISPPRTLFLSPCLPQAEPLPFLEQITDSFACAGEPWIRQMWALMSLVGIQLGYLLWRTRIIR